MVRLTGSPCFETAYFVIRAGKREPKRGEMVKEANRIISESDPQAVKKGTRLMGRGERLMLILYGVLGGAFSVAVAWLICLLFF